MICPVCYKEYLYTKPFYKHLDSKHAGHAFEDQGDFTPFDMLNALITSRRIAQVK